MSKFYKGFKYEIYPTTEQANQIEEYVNLYRFVYNWAISKEEERYEQYMNGSCPYKFINFFDLCYEYTNFRMLAGNEWLQKLPNTTARLALRDAVNAYNMFFKKHNRHPKFKSKKTSPKTFKTRSDRFHIKNGKLQIEGFGKNLINLGFDLDVPNQKFIQPSITIDKTGRYWVSYSVEQESSSSDVPKSDTIGIDLGIRKTFTFSTGEVFNKPSKKLEKIDRRISRLQRHITRDIKSRQAEANRMKTKYDEVPKSKRAIKREIARNKLYFKEHNIKKNFYYEIANEIVARNPKCVVMETIPVIDTAMKKPYMAKTISHGDFYWITQIVKQKCFEHEIPFMQADRSFPSSQICSNCGAVRNIGSRKIYICPVCGLRIDRDINAALNLKKLAESI